MGAIYKLCIIIIIIIVGLYKLCEGHKPGAGATGSQNELLLEVSEASEKWGLGVRPRNFFGATHRVDILRLSAFCTGAVLLES